MPSFVFFLSLGSKTHPKKALAVELDVGVILIVVVAECPGDKREMAAPRERRRRRRRRETAATERRRRKNHRTNSNGPFLRAAGRYHHGSTAQEDASLLLRARDPRDGADTGARGGGRPREGSHFFDGVEFLFFSPSSSPKSASKKKCSSASAAFVPPSHSRPWSKTTDWVASKTHSAQPESPPKRTRIGPRPFSQGTNPSRSSQR